MAVMPSDDNVLLSGIVGSHAYGLAGPDSDVDRLGVFVTPSLRLLGLAPPAESIVSAKPDTTFHEAGKAARLMLSCNPTVIELLWLPDHLYEKRSRLGDEAIAIRTSFLSARRVRHAYLGYATQQARKISSPARASDSVDARAKRVAKHARHLMRLVEQGRELYATGTMTLALADPRRYLDFGRRVAADPQVAASFMADAEARFDAVRTVLPEQPDNAVVEDWLLRVRKAYWTTE
jgi:predicted nucleotidyltransferase